MAVPMTQREAIFKKVGGAANISLILQIPSGERTAPLLIHSCLEGEMSCSCDRIAKSTEKL